ncbi:MAG: hypothetical protein IPN74_03660 [Haliscomenobacter sp.]|nr:hypothetical protein [Haliscomenobacter sp.]
MSLLDPSFAPESRVWIYQSNRPFSEAEEQELAAELKEFTRQWVSHNQRLKAAGTILYHRFIALMVDENQVGAGGCSIDRSVAFLKQVQATTGCGLLLWRAIRWSAFPGRNLRPISKAGKYPATPKCWTPSCAPNRISNKGSSSPSG